MPKRRGQKSSKPQGWIEKGLTCPVRLTSQQGKYARQACGNARMTYNLLADTFRFHRRNRLHWPLPSDLEKELNAVKHWDYPFLCGGKYPHKRGDRAAGCGSISKFVVQGAAAAFTKAWQGYHANNWKFGAPQRKTRKRTGVGGFLAATGVDIVRYDGRYRVSAPALGSVKLARQLPAGVIPVSLRIHWRNGQWLAAVNYYAPPPAKPARESQAVGGVDVGIEPLTSWAANDGAAGEDPNPKAFYLTQRKLRRWQRAQARRPVGSRGWQEAQRRIDKIHRRIVGLRNNAHHQASRRIINRFHTIGIESLQVKGMIRAGWQSKALADASMSSLLGQIRYKAEWAGVKIVTADRWFPSSKTCSNCGVVNAALGRERLWQCPACGVRHDRNRNAARNLLKLALGAVSLNGGPKADAVDAWRDFQAADVMPGDRPALAGGVKPPVKLARGNREQKRYHRFLQSALAL